MSDLAPMSRRPPAVGIACALAGLLLSMTSCADGAGASASVPDRASASSTYVGWRLYEARCAACHGEDAAGPAKVPGLLESVRGMGTRRFVDLVLERYDWTAAGADEVSRRSLAEDIVRNDEQAFAMPAWKDEPPVSAHILDLYAYLSARADGALGTGRPAR